MQRIDIYPLGNLSEEYNQSMHMYLTHLVEKYPMYVTVAQEAPGYKILDNSLIELGGAVELSRVLRAAETIAADEIILPDVFQKGPETLEAVSRALEELQGQPKAYKLMAVAQGRNLQEWYDCYQKLLNIPEIDVIGIPKVLAKMHPAGRPGVVNDLCDLNKKPHHLLGLWYSFEELDRYEHPEKIRSVDTVLLAYMAKYNLAYGSVRPDGFTIDLEHDVVNYLNVKGAHRYDFS